MKTTPVGIKTRRLHQALNRASRSRRLVRARDAGRWIARIIAMNAWTTRKGVLSMTEERLIMAAKYEAGTKSAHQYSLRLERPQKSQK
jgi:hypothetical protein